MLEQSFLLHCWLQLWAIKTCTVHDRFNVYGLGGWYSHYENGGTQWISVTVLTLVQTVPSLSMHSRKSEIDKQKKVHGYFCEFFKPLWSCNVTEILSAPPCACSFYVLVTISMNNRAKHVLRGGVCVQSNGVILKSKFRVFVCSWTVSLMPSLCSHL